MLRCAYTGGKLYKTIKSKTIKSRDSMNPCFFVENSYHDNAFKILPQNLGSDLLVFPDINWISVCAFHFLAGCHGNILVCDEVFNAGACFDHGILH